MITRFLDTDYLTKGTLKQKISYEILKQLQIFEKLEEYSPILVGTIPIGIDLDTSDLDIICDVKDFETFIELVDDNYSRHDDYHIKSSFDSKGQIVTISFRYEGSTIEIYAEDKPTFLQNGYKHMIVEHRLLELLGNEFRSSIIDLKKSGFKTEPAFAYSLDIEGDPYKELLRLYSKTDDEIIDFVQNMIDDDI